MARKDLIKEFTSDSSFHDAEISVDSSSEKPEVLLIKFLIN